MEIRIATAEDIKGILPLLPQIYRVKTLPNNALDILLSMIKSNDCDVIVAAQNNEVIGCASVFYLSSSLAAASHGKPFAYLEGIIVDKNNRKKGIGKALTDEVLRKAREKCCYKIIFTSGMDRSEIHKFYEKLGFKKWGYEFRMNLD